MKNAPIVGFGRPSYKPVDTIKYGYGTISPRSWGYRTPEKKKKR